VQLTPELVDARPDGAAAFFGGHVGGKALCAAAVPGKTLDGFLDRNGPATDDQDGRAQSRELAGGRKADPTRAAGYDGPAAGQRPVSK
jgi:hypothetical protein